MVSCTKQQEIYQVGESSRGNTIRGNCPATGLRASARESASERTSARTSAKPLKTSEAL